MPDLSSCGGMALGRTVCWLTEDTLIAQVNVAGVWQVCTRAKDDPNWTPLTEYGASMLAARAGHWLGFLSDKHDPEHSGLFGPGGLISPAQGLAGDMQAGRGVVGEDGTIGVLLDYQSGVGLRLWAADGAVVDLPDAQPAAAGVCVVDRERVLWLDRRDGDIDVYGGLPACHVLPGPVAWPHALYLADEWWIAYHSTDALGIILHPFADASEGYKIALPPAYYLAAVALDSSRVKLAWSSTPDDLTGREATIDVAHDPRVPLVAPFSVAPFDHPVLVQVFHDLAGESGVGQVGDGLGLYTEDPDPTAALATAERLHTRLLFCHDSPREWTLPGGLRPWDVPLVELYRLQSESLAWSVARWRDGVRSMLAQWPGDCGVIPMFYCQGGAPPDELWPVADVLDGLGYLSELVNLSPRIKVVAPFAWQRANGIIAHPELREAFESLKRATPGRPTFTPIGQEPPVPVPPTPKPPGGHPMPSVLPPLNYDEGYQIALEIADTYGAGSLGHGQSLRDAIGTVYHLLFGLLREGRTREAVLDEARLRGEDKWGVP